MDQIYPKKGEKLSNVKLCVDWFILVCVTLHILSDFSKREKGRDGVADIIRKEFPD